MSHNYKKLIKDPQYRHVLGISGGKDSAALAIYMNQQYSQIPAEYIFCDTQSELPETYEFLEKLEALLGKKIKHINQNSQNCRKNFLLKFPFHYNRN